MKNQINTIRKAYDLLIGGDLLCEVQAAGLLRDALAELEAMVGEQVLRTREPHLALREVHHHADSNAYFRARAELNTYGGRTAFEAGYQRGFDAAGALYTAPVAQQPQKLEDIEQYRMQMAGICTAAIGYWKEGDSIHPDYDTLALRDVAKLYAKYDALYKAQQPQAEAVPVVDRVYEAAKRLVDHADFQLGGVLSAKSKARDIPSNAASKVKARHLASLRDALAKTPQQAEAVPSDVVRDAVAAEREACAALAQGYAGQVGDVAWAVAAAIRGRGNAAIAQQKGN